MKRALFSSLLGVIAIGAGLASSGQSSPSAAAPAAPAVTSGAAAPAAAVAVAAVVAAPAAGTPPVANASSSSPAFGAANPARLLDSRAGTSTADGQFAAIGALASGATVEFTVAGRGGVPADASAAALNITSTDQSGGGYLTVWPCGAVRPLASSLNFAPGRDVANGVLARLGTGGKVCVFAGAASTHLVIDVNGWIPGGAPFGGDTPARLADTRPGASTVDGKGAATGALGAGGTLEVVVGGRGGVPTGASAAVLNVTSTGATGTGFLTVWPCGQTRPLASMLNFSAGRDVANGTVTALGAGGKVCVYAGSGATHVIVDVNAYLPAGATYAPVTPARLADTRSGATTTDGQSAGGGALPAGGLLDVVVVGRGNVPADAGVVALNVTSTGATGTGFLTVWPCGAARPLASTVNFSVGRDVANSVMARVGASGRVCLYAGAAGTHVVVDVVGSFSDVIAPPLAPADPPAPPPVATPLPPLTTGQWQNITPPIDITYRPVPAGANYGTQTVALSPSDPRIVYLGSCYQGVWKTTDAGATWAKVSTGVNGDQVSSGVNWTIAVDPTNPNVVYTASGGAGANMLWKSTDGGVNWQNILPNSIIDQTSPDVYAIAIDPADPKHLLVTFHGDWSGKTSAGVLESKDAGASWIIHQPAGAWGHSHYAFFITSSIWLVGMQDAGYWRTTDSGAHWTQVSDVIAAHGAVQLYRASNGNLFVAALKSILKSVDNGASWSAVGDLPGNTMPGSNGGYYTITGDGFRMYIQPGAAWENSPAGPYYVSAETDGVNWTPLNGQNFAYGPMSMVIDAKNGILYSSNWNGGFWRLKL